MENKHFNELLTNKFDCYTVKYVYKFVGCVCVQFINLFTAAFGTAVCGGVTPTQTCFHSRFYLKM